MSVSFWWRVFDRCDGDGKALIVVIRGVPLVRMVNSIILKISDSACIAMSLDYAGMFFEYPCEVHFQQDRIAFDEIGREQIAILFDVFIDYSELFVH